MKLAKEMLGLATVFLLLAALFYGAMWGVGQIEGLKPVAPLVVIAATFFAHLGVLAWKDFKRRG